MTGITSTRLADGRELIYKLKYLASFQAAMGAFINHTTPESGAERLRAVIVPGSVPSPDRPEGVHA